MKDTKRCPDCDADRPVEEFSLNARSPDGLAVYCKKHALARVMAWKKAHPEKVKAQRDRYIARTVKRNLELRAEHAGRTRK